MHKSTPIQHPIHELIRQRWSPVSLAEKPVEPEKLRSLFEAARWAPSSFGEQPWSFLVGTKGTPEFEALLGCLVEANAAWAKHAPVLILSVARRVFERNGKENRHYMHDTGMAAENLALEAVAQGLAIHQMAGFSVEKARESLGIPDTHEPAAMIAVGYPGDPSALPENLRQRDLAPRTRKPIGQFVFSGKWGQTTPLVGPST
jgi:nitroreductase